METTLTKTTTTEQIISGLRKAATELENFRVQAALGKAEAHDVFESAKKKLHRQAQEFHSVLTKSKASVKAKSNELRGALELLQLHLALGKAESKEIFEVQRKKLVRALKEIERLMGESKLGAEQLVALKMEVQKFKIKLEIIKLRFELNKIVAIDEFETRKKEFTKKLVEIKTSLMLKEKKVETKWEHFEDELADAYSHLKKAFTK